MAARSSCLPATTAFTPTTTSSSTAGTTTSPNPTRATKSATANLRINGASIHVVSSDDGINGAAGGDAMGQGGKPGGVPGQPPGGGGYAPRAVGDSYYLYIHGGYLAIDALGDGIDSNGSIAMTDGVVLVNGPTANNNGALDHISFDMTGGFLVAARSPRQARRPTRT